MTESEEHFTRRRNELMAVWAFVTACLGYDYAAFFHGGRIFEIQRIRIFDWDFFSLPFINPLLAGLFIAGMIFFHFARLKAPDVEQACSEFFDSLKVGVIFAGLIIAGLAGQRLFGSENIAVSVGMMLFVALGLRLGYARRVFSSLALANLSGIVGTMFFGVFGLVFFGAVFGAMCLGALGYFSKEMGQAIIRSHFSMGDMKFE